MTVTLPMPPAPPPVMRWGGRFAALLIGRLGRSPEVAVRHGRGDSGDGLVTIRGLYAARRLSLVRLAVLMVDDLPTAEDIVQDAFAALYRRHGDDLSAVDDPNAYLTTDAPAPVPTLSKAAPVQPTPVQTGSAEPGITVGPTDAPKSSPGSPDPTRG